MKPTPGPWRAVYPPDIWAAEHHSIHVYGHDSLVPSRKRRDPQCNVCVVNSYSKSERIANARLIAAAPDLLEVCRKLARLKSGPTNSKRAEWIVKILDLAADARVAIAKAKGDN